MNATSLVPRLSFFQHDDTIVKNLIIYGQGVPQSEKRAPPYSRIERSRNSNRYLKIPKGDLGL